MTTPVTNTTTPPATTSNGAQAGSNAMSQLTGNFDTFLTLLTTQLKNQDPTSPMDSNQFTQQLVEFSQVEQQIDGNTNLQTLISQGQTQAGVNANAYLGKTVTVTNGNASLTAGQANWAYNLGATAAASTLTVSNANGQVVYSGAGGTSAGAHSFNWDGKDNNGNQLADGVYTLAATAQANDGSAVTTNVSSSGTVSEIDMTGGTPKLVVGDMELAFSDISSIQ